MQERFMTKKQQQMFRDHHTLFPQGAPSTTTKSTAAAGLANLSIKVQQNPNDLLADRMFRQHSKKNRGKSAAKAGERRTNYQRTLLNGNEQRINGLFSPQTEVVSPIATEKNHDDANAKRIRQYRQFSNLSSSINDQHALDSSDSRGNQILYGDLQHSTKLKNLLRGSTKYQDKLNSLVKHYEKQPHENIFNRANSIGKVIALRHNRRQIPADVFNTQDLRTTACLRATSTISQPGETLLYDTFDLGSQAQGEAQQVSHPRTRAPENHYDSAILQQHINHLDLSKSPVELRIQSFEVAKDQNLGTLVQTIGDSTNQGEYFRDHHLVQSNQYVQNNLRILTSPSVVNGGHQQHSGGQMMLQIPQYYSGDQQQFSHQNIGNLMMFQDHSHRDGGQQVRLKTHPTFAQDQSNSIEGGHEVIDGNSNNCPQIQVYAVLNQLSESQQSAAENQIPKSRQNDQLNQRQNEADWEVQPWQQNVGESQTTNITQPPIQQENNLGAHGLPVPVDESGKEAKHMAFALIYGNQGIEETVQNSMAIRTEKMASSMSNRLESFQKASGGAGHHDSMNLPSHPQGPQAPRPQHQVIKLNQIVTESRFQDDGQADQAAPSQEDDYFDQPTMNHMQPSGSGANPRDSLNAQSITRLEPAATQPPQQSASATIQKPSQSPVSREEGYSFASIKDAAMMAEMERFEKLGKIQGKGHDQLMKLLYEQTQSIESSDFSHFFKNQSQESIAKIMAQAQMNSTNRFRSHFRGAKLVTASAWNRRRTTKPEAQGQSKKPSAPRNGSLTSNGTTLQPEFPSEKPRQQQQKLLLNTGYCKIVDEIKARRPLPKQPKTTKNQKWLRTGNFQAGMKKQKKIVTHVPQLPRTQVSPLVSKNNPTSPIQEKNQSDQVLYDKTPQAFPLVSTANTKLVNYDSYGPSERISIELGRVNISDDDKQRNLDELDAHRHTALIVADAQLTNNNNYLSTNNEQQSLLLQQESVQTKALANKQSSQNVNGRRSVKSQSVYSSVSNTQQRLNEKGGDGQLTSGPTAPVGGSTGSTGGAQDTKKSHHRFLTSPPNVKVPVRGSYGYEPTDPSQLRYKPERNSNPFAQGRQRPDGQMLRGSKEYALTQPLINSQPVSIEHMGYKTKITLQASGNAAENHIDPIQTVMEVKKKSVTENPSLLNFQRLAGQNSQNKKMKQVSLSKLSKASKLNKQPLMLDLSNDFGKIKPVLRSSRDTSMYHKSPAKITIQEHFQQSGKISSNQHIQIINNQVVNRRPDSVSAYRKMPHSLSQTRQARLLSGHKFERSSKKSRVMQLDASQEVDLKNNGKRRDTVDTKYLNTQSGTGQVRNNSKRQSFVNAKQNLDLSRVQMDEAPSNNEASQAFSEDSNVSPLVIKKAVMEDNNFALNLIYPKQPSEKDQHSNIQILNENQEDILDSSNSKQKRYKHRIDDIIKEEASSLNQKLDQKIAQRNFANPKYDSAKQTIENKGELQSQQFTTLKAKVDSGRRSANSNGETIRNVQNRADGTGARTARNKKPGDENSEIFQLNLSKGQQSSAQNKVLNSWRVSGSRSNHVESAKFTGRMIKADASQTAYLTQFDRTQEMLHDSKTGNTKSLYRNSMGIRTVDARSISKSRSSKERKSRSKNQSPAEPNDTNIVIQGGESFVKQTQHHLRVNIGSKETVHQTTTQIHPTAMPRNATMSINPRQIQKMKRESQLAVIDMVNRIHKHGSPLSQKQQPRGQQSDQLKIKGQRVIIKEKVQERRMSPTSAGSPEKVINKTQQEQCSISQNVSQITEDRLSRKRSTRGQPQIVYAMMQGEALAFGNRRKSSERIVDIKGKSAVTFSGQNNKDTNKSPSMSSNMIRQGGGVINESNVASPHTRSRQRTAITSTSHYNQGKQYGIARLFAGPEDLPPVCSDETILKKYKQNQNILKIAKNTRNLAIMQLAVDRKKKDEQIQNQIRTVNRKRRPKKSALQQYMSNELLDLGMNKDDDQNNTRIEVHIPDPADSKLQNLFTKRPSESYVALKKHFDHNLKYIKVQYNLMDTMNMPPSSIASGAHASLSPIGYKSRNLPNKQQEHERTPNSELRNTIPDLPQSTKEREDEEYSPKQSMKSLTEQKYN